MKKQATRFLALLLVVLTVLSILTISASAAGKTFGPSAKTGSSNDSYFKTGSSKSSRQIIVTTSYGKLGNRIQNADVYGSYEITISYWNGKKWVQEQHFDIYNSGNKTITLNRKNTIYKIHIYAWNPQTLYNSYWKNNVATKQTVCGSNKFRTWFRLDGKINSGAYWITRPSISLTPGKSCSMYTRCPV